MSVEIRLLYVYIYIYIYIYIYKEIYLFIAKDKINGKNHQYSFYLIYANIWVGICFQLFQHLCTERALTTEP